MPSPQTLTPPSISTGAPVSKPPRPPYTLPPIQLPQILLPMGHQSPPRVLGIYRQERPPCNMDWCFCKINGSPLQKLFDDFVKEANRSPDEYDLDLPTVGQVETAALETYWASVEKQFNSRFDYLGTRARHLAPENRIKHAHMDRFGNLDLCIKPLMKTSIKAHMRKIKSIQLNWFMFFMDPLTWVWNNQSPLDTDGRPDFNTDLPMDNEVAAELYMTQLQYELDTLQTCLGRYESSDASCGQTHYACAGYSCTGGGTDQEQSFVRAVPTFHLVYDYGSKIGETA
jgi:hypothetical protein